MEQEMELWRIGAIQFFGSYAHGGFSRGYADPAKNAPRDPYNETFRNMMEQAKNPLYKDIEFMWSEYDKMGWVSYPGLVLVYCDPPYQGTKPYGYALETKFDYDKYWNWVREQSEDKIVICSEQNFPNDFQVIWERKVKRTTNKENDFQAVEKLGILKEKYNEYFG